MLWLKTDSNLRDKAFVAQVFLGFPCVECSALETEQALHDKAFVEQKFRGKIFVGHLFWCQKKNHPQFSC